MNTRDLQYLIAVAEEQHFGKAAARCFVSQPALSMQLKKLEQTLGVNLFERNNKNVLITPVGKTIVEQARLILRQIDELTNLAEKSKDPFAGVFHLGIIPTVGPYLLPHILPAIAAHLPNLDLQVYENNADDMVRKCQEGDLDAMVLALPIAGDGIHSQSLYQEDVVVALPKSHPLTKKKTIHLQDLQNESLLLLAQGHCFRDQALEICAHAGISQHAGFQATSLETLWQLVAAGMGVTLLPQMAVAAGADRANCTIRPFAKPVPQREIGMCWRERSSRSEVCDKIAEVITACIGD